MTKSAVRRVALARRDAMDPAARCELSRQIPKAIDSSIPWRLQGLCLSLYHAIGSELDPSSLAVSASAKGAELALPVLLDQDTMIFRGWDASLPLVPVGFGTLGPDADQPEVVPDLIFAPLAAFSSKGQRIGYGKGHYDRALAKMQATGHRPVLIGLAFDEQEVDPFEAEDHDIPLDAVLTPTGLRPFGSANTRLVALLRDSEQP